MSEIAAPPLVTISALPAFRDNYIWVLRRGTQVAVVDPGDAAPVLNYLMASEAELCAVLITHHHADHVGGLAALSAFAGERLPVYGPTSSGIAGIIRPVAAGERIAVDGIELEFDVLAVPGHTADHLAYYGSSLGTAGALFCGDTLFGAGCGRLFEGTPAQMQSSLAKITVLPAPTLIYCAHEYTEANLRFARAVEPDNAALASRCEAVAALRAAGRASVPSTLADELATNPFLRWDSPAVRDAAARFAGKAPVDAVATFAAIRRWKDEFK
jgi:hydroxyacylglutathione hydrolase